MKNFTIAYSNNRLSAILSQFSRGCLGPSFARLTDFLPVPFSRLRDIDYGQRGHTAKAILFLHNHHLPPSTHRSASKIIWSLPPDSRLSEEVIKEWILVFCVRSCLALYLIYATLGFNCGWQILSTPLGANSSSTVSVCVRTPASFPLAAIPTKF